MKMKRFFALMLALVLVLTLAACGGSGDSQSGGNQPAGNPAGQPDVPSNPPADLSPEPKDFTIGFLGTMFGAGQDLSIKNYVEDVLKPAFPNVTTIYSAAYYTIENEKKELENLITQGADGIIVVSGLYDVVGILETCAASGVYVSLALGVAPQSDLDYIMGDADVMEYFLGFAGQSIESEYEAGVKAAVAGKEMAGPDGTIAVLGMQGFVADSYQYRRIDGVKDELGDRYDPKLFFNIEWGDSTMTMASDVLAQAPEVVVTTTAGADILCGIAAAKGATETTQITAVGYIDKTNLTYFENGSLDYSESVYGEQAAGAFILMYNWLNNNLRWSSDKGNFAWVNIPYVSIPDVDTMRNWMNYCGTVDKTPFSADDVKTCLIQYNQDASYQDFTALMQAVSFEDVQARRG